MVGASTAIDGLGEPLQSLLCWRMSKLDDDDNEPLVIWAKRAGRALGYVVVGYLGFSIGRMFKLW